MPAAGFPTISARTGYPDTIVAGEDYRARLELVRDGLPITPVVLGTVMVIDRNGAQVASGPATMFGNALGRNIAAAVTADLPLGQLYQVRWDPEPTAESGKRTYRREAVVAKFALVPPIADDDLTVGNYPDLVSLLGDFADTGPNGESTLQPYIDEAWNWVVRKLLKVGRWQDQLVSTYDVLEVTRERAWFLIFRFLFRSASGDAVRFETLMTDHKVNSLAEWQAVSGRWDNDHDGLADSEDRDPASGLLHRNAAPRRRLSRSSRW